MMQSMAKGKNDRPKHTVRITKCCELKESQQSKPKYAPIQVYQDKVAKVENVAKDESVAQEEVKPVVAEPLFQDDRLFKKLLQSKVIVKQPKHKKMKKAKRPVSLSDSDEF